VSTQAWTQGAAWGTKLTTWGVTLLVVLGIIAASVMLSRATAPAATAAAPAPADSRTVNQAASAYATDFFRAWMTSTAREHEQLDPYLEGTLFSNAQLPSTARGADQISVVSVDVSPEDDITVTLGAQIGSDTRVPLRYFQVLLVSDTDGELSATALPTEVNAPARQGAANGWYGVDAFANRALRDSVRGFAAAYLAGAGDLERYLSPGASIMPLTPAPYTAVDVSAVSANREVPDEVTDGTEIYLLVRLKLSSGAGYTISSDYALTATARAGRWEITSIGTPTAKQGLEPSTSANESAATESAQPSSGDSTAPAPSSSTPDSPSTAKE